MGASGLLIIVIGKTNVESNSPSVIENVVSYSSPDSKSIGSLNLISKIFHTSSEVEILVIVKSSPEIASKESPSGSTKVTLTSG